MREIDIAQTDEMISIAKRAADYFATNENFVDFFLRDGIRQGGLIALRSGVDDVIVFKISDDCEPVKFQGLIETYRVEGE